MEKSKTCFVISPIGAAQSEQRKNADIVLKHIFKAALEPLGYKVVRADEISQPGSITLQVLEMVLECKLVIADLTDHNPNVFYELAVRHASQKPVIHVIASDQKIPFDVADLRTIAITTDLDGAALAREQIISQAKEIEAGNIGETPVKLAGVLKHLETGKSDEKLILKQILDGITELRSDFRRAQLHNDNGEERAYGDPVWVDLEGRSGLPKKRFEEAKGLLHKALQLDGDRLLSIEVQTPNIQGSTPMVEFKALTESGKTAKIWSHPLASPRSIAETLFRTLKDPEVANIKSLNQERNSS